MFERFQGSDWERTFTAVDLLRRRMEQVFGGAYDEPEPFAQTPFGGPAMALTDEGTTLTLRAELPGLSEKDIELTLVNDVLTVKGERRLTAPEGYAAHRQERAPYKFTRSFTLPARIDGDKIGATMKDGVLTVQLAKVPESQPRQIAVKVQ